MFTVNSGNFNLPQATRFGRIVHLYQSKIRQTAKTCIFKKRDVCIANAGG